MTRADFFTENSPTTHQWLREFRQDLDLSLRELGEFLGVNYIQVWKWETGRVGKWESGGVRDWGSDPSSLAHPSPSILPSCLQRAVERREYQHRWRLDQPYPAASTTGATVGPGPEDDDEVVTEPYVI